MNMDQERMSFVALSLTRRLLARHRRRTGETTSEVIHGATQTYFALSVDDQDRCLELVERMWGGTRSFAQRDPDEQMSLLINTGLLVHLRGLLRVPVKLAPDALKRLQTYGLALGYRDENLRNCWLTRLQYNRLRKEMRETGLSMAEVFSEMVRQHTPDSPPFQ